MILATVLSASGCWYRTFLWRGEAVAWIAERRAAGCSDPIVLEPWA